MVTVFTSADNKKIIKVTNFPDPGDLIARITIPSGPLRDGGKFVVFGRVIAVNGDNDAQNATAQLITGKGSTVLDRVDVRIPSSSLGNEKSAVLSLQGVFSLPCDDPFTTPVVELRCSTYDGWFNQPSLILIVVDDLQTSSNGINFSPFCP